MKQILLFCLLFSSCSDVDVIKFKDEIIPVESFTTNREVNEFLLSFKDTINAKSSRLLDLWGSTSCFLELTHKGEDIGIFSIYYEDSLLVCKSFSKYSINNERIEANIINWYSIDDSILSNGISSPTVSFTNDATGETSTGEEFIGIVKDLAEKKQIRGGGKKKK